MSESRREYIKRVSELSQMLSARAPGGLWGDIYADAVTLIKLGRRAERDAERVCNEEGYESKDEQIEKRARAIAEKYGLTADTQGDPRGYCLRLHGAGLRGNSWGGDEAGYGV
jgi:hypothetical protein